MITVNLKARYAVSCVAIITLAACNPVPPRLPTTYQNLSDDEIMILFTKSIGAMDHDYRNPQAGVEELEREVSRRKLASLGDIEKIRMAGRYAEQGEAYVGMRSKVLVALRGEPYIVRQIGATKKLQWGNGFISSQNRYTTRDYVCVRESVIVGVRYTWCNYGDCSSNKERGEDC